MAYLGKINGPKISDILKRQGHKGTQFVGCCPCGLGGAEASFEALIREAEKEEENNEIKPVLINKSKMYGKGSMYVSFQGTAGLIRCSISLTKEELEQLGDDYERINVNFDNINLTPPGGDGFSHTDF